MALPRSMLVDPHTYWKQLDAYRRWIMASALEVVKARNVSVPATRISVDAFEVIEFEIELAHVSTVLLADAKICVISCLVNYIVYWNL